jgi:hypothetical protein
VYFQHPESERFRARAVRDCERISAQPAKLRFWSRSIEFAVQKLGVVLSPPDGNATPLWDDTTAD